MPAAVVTGGASGIGITHGQLEQAIEERSALLSAAAKAARSG